MHVILLFYMICIITVHNEVIISIKRNIKVIILSKKLILKTNILTLSICVIIFLFAQKLLKILFLI